MSLACSILACPFVETLIALWTAFVATSSQLSPDSSALNPTSGTKASSTTQVQQQAIPLDDNANNFFRGLILLLLPDTFEDSDDWGSQRRIQSGLNVDISRGKLSTSRRWKNVNHGSWSQLTAQLHDPANTFSLSITRLPDNNRTSTSDVLSLDPELTNTRAAPNANITRFAVTCDASINATGRHQQWSYGLMLWSISTDVDLRFHFDTTVRIQRTTRVEDGRILLALNPFVEFARVQLMHFRVKRISHVKGSVAREFGSWFSPMVQKAVRKANSSLTDKINRKLQKAQDKFELPVWKNIFSTENTTDITSTVQGESSAEIRSESPADAPNSTPPILKIPPNEPK